MLTHDKPLSNFDFNFSLRPYTQGGLTPLPLTGGAEQLDALFTQLSLLDDWFEGVTGGTVEPQGIISLKRHVGGVVKKTKPAVAEDTSSGDKSSVGGGGDGKTDEADDMIYDEFTPFPLAQHSSGDGGVKHIEGGFDFALAGPDLITHFSAQLEPFCSGSFVTVTPTETPPKPTHLIPLKALTLSWKVGNSCKTLRPG